MPVAVNCRTVPAGADGVNGVTAIDANAVAVTVIAAVPLTWPRVAIKAVLPAPTPLASPALFVATTAVFAEVQVVVAVTSCVVPSL